MKPSEALARHRAAIYRVVESHHARNPRVFGSALHGTDTEQSDLDLLVDLSTIALFDGAPSTLFEGVPSSRSDTL